MANKPNEPVIIRAADIVRDEEADLRMNNAVNGIKGDPDVFHKNNQEFRRFIEESSRAKESRGARDFTEEELRKTNDFRMWKYPIPDLGPDWKVTYLEVLSPQGRSDVALKLKLGYKPVTLDELEGQQFERYAGMPINGWEGYLSSGDLVCFKIHVDDYNVIMKRYHDQLPREMADAQFAKETGFVQSTGGEIVGAAELYNSINLMRSKKTPQSWT